MASSVRWWAAMLVAVTVSALLASCSVRHRPGYVGPVPSAGSPWKVADVVAPGGSAALLTDITASGPRDAWAVAQVGDPPVSGVLSVLHWDGLSWRSMPPLPSPARNAGSALVGASGTSDAWVFTDADALHWDGTQWTAWAAPACGQAFPAVFGPRDVWAFSSGYKSCAARFDGRAWHAVAMPGVPDAVSALGADDIWATGATASTAPQSPGPGLTPPVYIAMHWNGRSWRAIAFPDLRLGSDQHLESGTIAAAGPRDVWVEYGIGTEASNASTALLLHWNGRSWRRYRIPLAPNGVWSMAVDGRGGLWLTAGGTAPAGERWYFYHLTARKLLLVPAPGHRSTIQLFMPAQITRVPGTTRLWGIEDYSGAGGGARAAILSYQR